MISGEMPWSWRDDRSHLDDLTGLFRGHDDKGKAKDLYSKRKNLVMSKEICESNDIGTVGFFFLTSKIDLQFLTKIPYYFYYYELRDLELRVGEAT